MKPCQLSCYISNTHSTMINHYLSYINSVVSIKLHLKNNKYLVNCIFFTSLPDSQTSRIPKYHRYISIHSSITLLNSAHLLMRDRRCSHFLDLANSFIFFLLSKNNFRGSRRRNIIYILESSQSSGNHLSTLLSLSPFNL